MKMLILKDSRITVKAGEIVEVSPAQADFLMSTRSAVPAPAKKAPVRENPEFAKAFEAPEATADGIVETVDAVPETPETPEAEAKKPKTSRKSNKNA